MAAKKKSSKGKGITKSGFIRSLPDRTPAKEVIAKAKDAGLDLTEKHVWTVQSEMRSGTKGGAKKKSAKKKVKKATQTTSAPMVTAAASATPDAPAQSAPTKSATAKSKTKKSKTKKSRTKKSPQKKPVAKDVVKTAASAESASAAQKMKSLIVQLGTDRADELYRAMRKEIDALVAR